MKIITTTAFEGTLPEPSRFPLFDVLVKGVAYPTREVEVTIYEKSQKDSDLDATKPLFGKLELSKESFYVNEIVPFSFIDRLCERTEFNRWGQQCKDRKRKFCFLSRSAIFERMGRRWGNSFYTSAARPPPFLRSSLAAIYSGLPRSGCESWTLILDSDCPPFSGVRPHRN